jgi:hypothetical protein
MNKQEVIHNLRDCAREIRRLREHITQLKAEAWDVHAHVVKRLSYENQPMGVCPAWQAEELAKRLDEQGEIAAPPEPTVDTRPEGYRTIYDPK